MDKLELCKKCKNRKPDLQRGIVCGLTDEKSAFEESCPDFSRDETVKEHVGWNLKPNDQRAKAAIALIWIVLALEILSLISSGLQYDLLKSIQNGAEVSDAGADANDLREGLVSIVYLVTFIISGIVFIMWFRRAYYNLYQKVNMLSHSEGWAAGCWFVPVVNLFRPYQIMRELFERTQPLVENKPDSPISDFNLHYLGIWWALWVLTNFIGQFSFNFFKNAETISNFLNSTIIDIFSSILGIISALIVVHIVKSYSKLETILYRESEF